MLQMSTRRGWVAVGFVLCLLPWAKLRAEETLAVTEKRFPIPKKAATGQRHALALDSVLLVSTGKEVLALSPKNKIPRRLVGSKAWLTPARQGFAIISQGGVVVRKENCEIRKSFPGVRPLFSADGTLAAIRKTGSSAIKFLGADFETSAEDQGAKGIHGIVLDAKSRTILFVASAHVPFSPAQSISLWRQGKLVVDIGKKWQKARYHGASRTGHVYISVPKGAQRRVLCLDHKGQEVWRKDVADGTGRMFLKIVTSKLTDSVFVGYEDPSVKSEKGSLRMLLLGPSGKTIRNCSDASYNHPLVSPDGSYAMLTGEKEALGVELPSGKTVWRKDTQKLIGGGDPRRISGSALTMVGKEPLYVLLIVSGTKRDKAQASTSLLGISLRTGSKVYSGRLPGIQWRVHASRRGTLWAVSPESGEGRCLVLQSTSGDAHQSSRQE